MHAEARPADLSVRERLEGWRTRGLERFDPVAFHRLDALERRVAACHGLVRQRLQARLDTLLAAHVAVVQQGDDGAAACAHIAAPPTLVSAPTSLQALLAHMGQQAPVSSLSGPASKAMSGGPAASAADAYPDLPMLEQVRHRWSQLHRRGQLRQSLGEVPENAGPLNSGRLVHRALSLMRTRAPAYLQHFLSYADTLSWLEGMAAAATPQATAKPVAAKRSRSKSK